VSYHNIQRVWVSSPRPSLRLLSLLVSLNPSLPLSISSHVIHSGTTSSPTPLLSVIFHSILGPKSHCAPLTKSSLLFFSSFSLSSILLSYLSTLFFSLILWIHSNPHIISKTYCILLTGSMLWFFSHTFSTTPPSARGFTHPSYQAPCTSFFFIQTTSSSKE
jgi:hypothetical protein